MSKCCIVYQSGYSECSCFFGSNQAFCEVGLLTAFPNSFDPIVATTWFATDSDCYANCPGFAASAMCANASGGVSQCTDGVVQSQCSGTFIPNATCQACSSGGGANSTDGICCKSGTCLTSATNKIACDAACGHWISNVQINDVLHPQNPNTSYQFGSNPNDCEICSLMRPVLSVIDVCSCTPAAEIIPHKMSSTESCTNTPIEVLQEGGCPATLTSDLIFNNLALPVSYVGNYDGQYKTAREMLIELLTCPVSAIAEQSFTYMADQVMLKWSTEYNVTPHKGCTTKCCTCPNGIGSVPVCETPYGGGGSLLFSNLCNQTYCPDGSFLSTGAACGGINQTGGGGGNTNETTSCFSGSSYCLQYPGLQCDCSLATFTNNTLTDVKIYINSTEWICVPVACGNCSGYDLCEVT